MARSRLTFPAALPTPPIQGVITQAGLANLEIGRRQLSTEWPKALYPPSDANRDWAVILPFRQSYANAFETMCKTDAHLHDGAGGRLCIYLRDVDQGCEPPRDVQDWINIVGKYVAMQDKLALSFALDYERERGAPGQNRTAVGDLRSQAKPYGAQGVTVRTIAAADALAERCLTFLSEMSCYQSAADLVAMPPSDPEKP